jgi:hypothetical protein
MRPARLRADAFGLVLGMVLMLTAMVTARDLLGSRRCRDHLCRADSDRARGRRPRASCTHSASAPWRCRSRPLRTTCVARERWRSPVQTCARREQVAPWTRSNGLRGGVAAASPRGAVDRRTVVRTAAGRRSHGCSRRLDDRDHSGFHLGARSLITRSAGHTVDASS